MDGSCRAYNHLVKLRCLFVQLTECQANKNRDLENFQISIFYFAENQ